MWKRFVMILALLVGATRVEAQKITMIEPVTTDTVIQLRKAVHQSLSEQWDDKNPRQLERGYCLLYEKDSVRVGNKISIVFDVFMGAPTVVTNATQVGSTINCIFGAWLPLTYLHVHPPATCDELPGPTRKVIVESCILGGEGAYQGFPSDTDHDALDGPHKFFFALIQYDRTKFIAYTKHSRLIRPVVLLDY